jgi:hypothetical protein
MHGAEMLIEGGKSNRAGATGASIIMKTNSAERMRISPDGNVGIGTTHPTGKMHIYGGAGQHLKLHREDGNVAAYINIQYDHMHEGTSAWKSYIQSYSEGTGRTRLIFFTSELGGINQRFVIYASGGAWLSGSLDQSSDISLKKNIELLPYGLRTISKLNPVQYHFNEQNDMEHKHFGFIAQEVQNILPELVGVGGDDKLTLSYIELIPILINGMKEQSEIITQQQQSINELSARLSSMEQLVKGLIR